MPLGEPLAHQRSLGNLLELDAASLMIIDPHYPHIVLTCPYRHCTIELEQSVWQDVTTYTAWVNYETGSAVAVPKAWTRTDAIKRAKQWIDRNFDSVPVSFRT